MHHLWEVSAGGGDDPSNLMALCPTDHALYHRGTISSDSIYAYKAMLVALGQAFDLEAIDRLLFLAMCPKGYAVWPFQGQPYHCPFQGPNCSTGEVGSAQTLCNIRCSRGDPTNRPDPNSAGARG
jgi:hypothetical protein